MKCKRRISAVGGLLLALATAHSAEAAVPRVTYNAEAVQALQDVAFATDNDAADRLWDRVADSTVTLEQWQLDYKQYFTNGVFTIALAQFWEAALANAEGAGQARIGLLSTVCATQAVTAAIPNGTTLPAAFDSLKTAFTWLELVCPRLGVNERTTAFATLTKTLEQQNLSAYARDPQRYGFYVQAAITLREFAGSDPQARGVVAKMLGLAAGPLSTWQAHGILVLDNGAFSDQHFASLNSVLAAIPAELHAIRAIIVPEATGIPAGTPFNTSGQIVFLSFIPMQTMTAPQEFITNGKPVAPAFTVAAAQEIVRAVQAVQFAKRPALAARRDIILANAQLREERYLRHYRIIAPSVYINNPDELLPRLAYVYFINSRAVFDMAAALFALRAQEPMDQFLLMADLLSGGSNTANLYETTLDGGVHYAPATIGRVHGSWIRAPYGGNTLVGAPIIPADLWFCNAIAYGGTSYVFELDEHGITTRFIRK